MDEQKKSEPTRSLARAIRDARVGDIEQSSVVIELGDTERARLEMLEEALVDVSKELPEDFDMLALQIVPGRKPRFWIDIVSFVEMARDKRSYRFLKDTRLGRVVVAESANVEGMADSITHYLAERVLEREKALESDHLLQKMSQAAQPAGADAAKAAERSEAGSGSIWWFLLGILVGAIGLVLYAWYMPTQF